MLTCHKDILGSLFVKTLEKIILRFIYTNVSWTNFNLSKKIQLIVGIFKTG